MVIENLERFERHSNCSRECIPYVEGDQKDIINTVTRKADGVDMETEREEDRQRQEKTKLWSAVVQLRPKLSWQSTQVLLSGWAPWAPETITRKGLRRSECFCAGLAPTAGSLGWDKHLCWHQGRDRNQPVLGAEEGAAAAPCWQQAAMSLAQHQNQVTAQQLATALHKAAQAMAALQPCISHRLSLLQAQLPHSLVWRNKLVVKGFSPPYPMLLFSQIRFLIWFITQLNKTTVPANQRAYQRDKHGWLGAKTVLGQHSCQKNCQTAFSEGYRVCTDREIYGDTLKR